MTDERKQTILVVDDNDDVRLLVKKVLRIAGYKVLEASDGQEALDITDEVVPDLILMDLRLPGELDGLETTMRMRDDSRLARVPIVALTASVLDRDRRAALEAGCSGFVGKPLDITVLPQLVETFISRGVSKPR